MTQTLEKTTLTYFDHEASKWSKKYQSRTFRERLNTVLEWLPSDGSDLSLLDYGCGSGVFMAELIQRGFHVTGVDASSGMVNASKEGLESLKLDQSQYQLELVEDPNFNGTYQQTQYDGIYSMGVLEYIKNDSELLDILISLIKPGGFLLVSLPNQNSLLRNIERFVYQNPTLFRTLGMFSHLTGEDAYLNFQEHQYSFSSFKKKIESNGFRLEKSKFHVAPTPLLAMSNSSGIGMTMILKFIKT